MTTTYDVQIERLRSIEALNALLRGEMAAVETYEHAMDTFGIDAPDLLAQCLNSHRRRVERLMLRIIDLGAQPVEGSGMWGAFAKLVEEGASLFGVGGALAALEEGEDHGLTAYHAQVDRLDRESRRIVEDELLPEQQRSHAKLQQLRQIQH